MSHSLFIYLFIKGKFASFQFGEIIDKAAMNIGEHDFMWTDVLISFV